MYITYPKSIKGTHYVFKLNTDDFPKSTPINRYLKSKGIEYKKSMQYSKTKLMAWHVYKIKTQLPIQSFEENIEFVEELFTDYIN